MTRKTVLIVEDNDDLRAFLADSLALAGFVVRQAADGMEALRMLDGAPPDLLVLDLWLPQVSGHDILLDVKENAHTRHIPVVVVTGNPGPVEGVAPDCLLKKPVSADALVKTVQACLDNLERQ